MRLGQRDVLLNVMVRYSKFSVLVALELDNERLLGKIRRADLPH